MLQMNQKSITTILAHLNLYVFTFLFLSDHCFCIDPYYEACVPKDCGNGLEISYPFYILHQQQSYCGYPGFELNCTSNGFPILPIPDNDYIVQDIDYTNQSLRVYNAAITNNLTNGCFPLIRNVTLDRNSVFRMENYSNVVLLSDCLDDQLDERLRSYRVGCNVSHGGEGLAMLDSDGNLGLAKEECGVNVLAPVEWRGGNERIGIGSWSYYEELLRRGFLLKWTAGDCSICKKSGGRCGFNETSFFFRCFCPDRPHVWSCPTRPQRKVKLALAFGISAVGVLIVVILLCYFWRKWSFCKWTFSIRKIRKDDNIEALLKKYGSLAPERYRYSDIKKMTNSFKEKLGQGGYGGVYKGMLPDGRIVAVKILNKPKGSGEDFVNEVTSISRTSHVNIVSLLGFCFEGSKRALIYEFMPNGSLEKFIYNDKSTRGCQLGWEKLNEIALGIARGLEYLHRGCNMRILHFDIKPHNILLTEDFFPKICDFGLAKLCPEKKSLVSMSGMRGTPGYIAPELFFRNYGGASHKSDVYSYGMMLLEMVGGRKNIEVEVDHSDIYFPDWLYNRLEQEKGIKLDGITNEDEDLSTRKMIIVGLWCIQTDPTDRPSMTKVVEMLEGSVESLQIPPKPVLINSPRCEEYSSTTHS